MSFLLDISTRGRTTLLGLTILVAAPHLSGALIAGPSEGETAIQKAAAGPSAAVVRPAAAVKPGTSDARTVPVPTSHSQAADKRGLLPALRDPFRSPSLTRPLRIAASVENAPRPAGVAGLSINQLRLRGLVEEKSSQMMVAVVTGADNLAYFLHVGDRLYDGTVARITSAGLYLNPKSSPSDMKSTAGPVVLHLQADAEEKP